MFILFFVDQGKCSKWNGNFFLESTKKGHTIYIELIGDTGKVFKMGGFLDKAGSGYLLDFTDTLLAAESSAYLYEGAKTKIQKLKDDLYVIYAGSIHKKVKRIKIDTTEQLQKIYYALNNGYWWNSFMKLAKETAHLNSDWRDGFKYWDSFTNKDIYYKDFFLFADEKIKEIKESIRKEYFQSSN